uniref:Uncharacterized protein n=1 Tax=Ciona intestinalis TaxID=7719 RepID=H2XTV3_CIOIN
VTFYPNTTTYFIDINVTDGPTPFATSVHCFSTHLSAWLKNLVQIYTQ